MGRPICAECGWEFDGEESDLVCESCLSNAQMRAMQARHRSDERPPGVRDDDPEFDDADHELLDYLIEEAR